MACPLSNRSTQLVGLLLQLPDPLRLLGEIATEFGDLAFYNIGQCGGSRRQLATRRPTCYCRLRHNPPGSRYPGSRERRCMYCLERRVEIAQAS